MSLAEHDPEMFALIEEERKRQAGGLELIASEVRPCVLKNISGAPRNRTGCNFMLFRHATHAQLISGDELF